MPEGVSDVPREKIHAWILFAALVAALVALLVSLTGDSGVIERELYDASGERVGVEYYHEGAKHPFRVVETLPAGGERESFDRDEDGAFELSIEKDSCGGILSERVSLADDGRWQLLRLMKDDGVVIEKYDFDADGRFEEEMILRDGERVSMRADRNGDGRIDEWVEFEDGKPVKLSRDLDGDGKPDYVLPPPRSAAGRRPPRTVRPAVPSRVEVRKGGRR